MGAWGTGIFDDDTTCDVKDEFVEYLDEGESVEDATRLVLENYLDEFDAEEDLEVISLVYIGLAATQMERNCLLEEIRLKTIHLIEKGADLELWEEADEQDYEKRKKILNEFKRKLMEYEE